MAPATGSLTNKYRPRSFNDVVGQPSVVAQLRGLLSRNKELPPAVMFYGPSGTGKTTLARLTSLYFNCAELKDGEPCGTCGSCKSMNRLISDGSESPDVAEMNVAMYGGIEAIRKLADVAPLSPRFKYRIFILDEVHQITHAAINGALKLLENAPPRTKFFLVTTNPEKLPNTIMGRCENKFMLQPLNAMDVAKRLYTVLRSEGIKVQDDFAKKTCIEIANACGGDLRSALGSLDNVINFIIGNGGVEGMTEILQERIIAQASQGAPYTVVQQYLSAIFSGTRGQAFYAIKQVQNHDYFVRKVLESLQQVIYMWIERNALPDPDKLWILKGVNTPTQEFGRKVLSLSTDMDTIMDEYARALERIKTYVSDPISALQIATLRTLRIVDAWKAGRLAYPVQVNDA